MKRLMNMLKKCLEILTAQEAATDSNIYYAQKVGQYADGVSCNIFDAAKQDVIDYISQNPHVRNYIARSILIDDTPCVLEPVISGDFMCIKEFDAVGKIVQCVPNSDESIIEKELVQAPESVIKYIDASTVIGGITEPSEYFPQAPTNFESLVYEMSDNMVDLMSAYGDELKEHDYEKSARYSKVIKLLCARFNTMAKAYDTETEIGKILERVE